MNINTYVPNGFTSWTEYYHHNATMTKVKDFVASLFAGFFLLALFGLNSAIDMGFGL